MDLRAFMINNKCEWTLVNGEYNIFHAYHEPSNGEQHHGVTMVLLPPERMIEPGVVNHFNILYELIA